MGGAASQRYAQGVQPASGTRGRCSQPVVDLGGAGQPAVRQAVQPAIHVGSAASQRYAWAVQPAGGTPGVQASRQYAQGAGQPVVRQVVQPASGTRGQCGQPAVRVGSAASQPYVRAMQPAGGTPRVQASQRYARGAGQPAVRTGSAASQRYAWAVRPASSMRGRCGQPAVRPGGAGQPAVCVGSAASQRYAQGAGQPVVHQAVQPPSGTPGRCSQQPDHMTLFGWELPEMMAWVGAPSLPPLPPWKLPRWKATYT
ncbi:hypothetical protein B0H11DRAFT_1941391 [Mycena galericulata]|nr:hypothetical protein B0H11DRAFT_1941391 [Mycena galericulata]